jgi:hypothetical protein
MLEEILVFTIRWLPTLIWTILCLYGITLGVKEMKQAIRDMGVVNDEEDPRSDVAEGTYKTALKNTAIQAVFLFFMLVVVFSRVSDPEQLHEPVGFIRSFVTPSLLIFAEWMLVSQLRGIQITRERVKKKAMKMYQFDMDSPGNGHAERERVDAEEGRKLAEEGREEAEIERRFQEGSESATEGRVFAEGERVHAEGERIIAEIERERARQKKNQKAEDKREEAEEKREEAENLRQKADRKRTQGQKDQGD